MKTFWTITISVFLSSCSGPLYYNVPKQERNGTILRISAECVDTLRTVTGATNSIPPHIFYEDIAFIYRVTVDLDLFWLARTFPKSFAIKSKLPDDSLNVSMFTWGDGFIVEPNIMRVQFLVRTSRKGGAQFAIASPWEGFVGVIQDKVDKAGVECNFN